MGYAANGLVDFLHFGRQRDVGSGVETFLNLGEAGVVVYTAPYDVELAGGAATLGVDAVTLASHRYHTATMEERGQAELGLDSVVVVARAQSLSGLCMLAVQVAGLYHEVLDDAMEQQGVVDVLLDEAQEVVAMLWRLVEKRYTNVARCGLEQYLGGRSLTLRTAYHQCEGQ